VDVVEHPDVPARFQPASEYPVPQVCPERRTAPCTFPPTGDHHVGERMSAVGVTLASQFGFVEGRFDLGGTLRAKPAREGVDCKTETPW
jgi:hypothetical protein